MDKGEIAQPDNKEQGMGVPDKGDSTEQGVGLEEKEDPIDRRRKLVQTVCLVLLWICLVGHAGTCGLVCPM